ncbi:hypothetical protein ZWY2020_008005 [Hordeum vulgare]|nr:hypothetical protein ZWY2020_008005 [Hordeum vulgare]
MDLRRRSALPAASKDQIQEDLAGDAPDRHHPIWFCYGRHTADACPAAVAMILTATLELHSTGPRPLTSTRSAPAVVPVWRGKRRPSRCPCWPGLPSNTAGQRRGRRSVGGREKRWKASRVPPGARAAGGRGGEPGSFCVRPKIRQMIPKLHQL